MKYAMKRTFAILIITMFLTLPIVYADEEDSLEDIEEYADKIKDLIEKYKNAEIDVVKKEIFKIRDIEGNPQDCDVTIYYNNGRQAKFRTKNGDFDGNFNHDKKLPSKPMSLRLSGCNCRVESTTHKVEYLQINEIVEKIRDVIESEVKDYSEEKTKEFAEKGVKKVFEKLGYGAAASGFLTGFGYGAALGAPIGEYITENINKILDTFRDLNVKITEANLLDNNAPAYPNIGWVKSRGFFGNLFGSSPKIKNTWDVKVRCEGDIIGPADASWNAIDDIIERPKITPRAPWQDPEESGADEEDNIESEADRRAREEREKQEQLEREKRERERQERLEQERRQREQEERERQQREELERKLKECLACKECEKFIDARKIAEKELNDLYGDLNELNDQKGKLDLDIRQTERDAQRAQRDLDRFNNPDSWIESNGRRVDSQDLAISRYLSRLAWSKYQSGEISADETMRQWGRSSTTSEEVQRIKEQMKKDIEKRINEANERKSKLEKDRQQKKQEIEQKEKEIEKKKSEIENLKRQYEDCIKDCAKKCMPQEEEQTLLRPETGERKTCSASDYCCLLKDRAEAFGVYDFNPNEEYESVSRGQHEYLTQLWEKCLKQSQDVEVIQEQVSTGSYQEGYQEETQKSCSEICLGYGMVDDPNLLTSYILDVLNRAGVCKSSASVSLRWADTAGCRCYNKDPQISISEKPLVCKGTMCGDVACGETVECAYGEGTATVSCSWKGWFKEGQQYVPKAG